MPIADGEPADGGDIWSRVLTDENYIRKGKLHPHAFKGRAAIAPPGSVKKRSWSHELSGRLRSLTTDVSAEAHAFCEEAAKATGQNKTFSGVMYCCIPDAHQTFETTIFTQVHYTPQLANKAHADFTFTGSDSATEEVFDRLRLWLCELFIGLHPAQIKLLPEASTPPARYAAPD
jgi:hypothetical protein